MCDLIQTIAQADEREIGELLKAVLQRYAVLFPDWEVTTISLQKDADKNGQIDRIVNMLRKMKTSS